MEGSLNLKFMISISREVRCRRKQKMDQGIPLKISPLTQVTQLILLSNEIVNCMQVFHSLFLIIIQLSYCQFLTSKISFTCLKCKKLKKSTFLWTYAVYKKVIINVLDKHVLWLMYCTLNRVAFLLNCGQLYSFPTFCGSPIVL